MPFVQAGNVHGLPTYEATAEDFEVPAGTADWEADTGNQSGLSRHRIYDAIQLTKIGVYILGTAATPGNGEIYIGAMPLETLEQGLAYWRMDIEVIE